MLVRGSGGGVAEACWLSTEVSTNGGQKGPTGAYETIRYMASELRKHYYSILRRNSGKNF
jgi:hypothetical protein